MRGLGIKPLRIFPERNVHLREKSIITTCSY